MLVVDIETGPQLNKIAKIFEETDFSTLFPHPGEFDESKVSYGNAKKPETRAPITEAAKLDHAARVESHPEELENFKNAYFEGMLDKAPLDPLMGQILAIGMRDESDISIAHQNGYFVKSLSSNVCGTTSNFSGEATVLERAWMLMEVIRNRGEKIVGVNIWDFDLPWMVKRSWIQDVTVPDWVSNGRYWDKCFVDLEVKWNMGDTKKMTSADAICEALGIEGKGGEVTGATFWRYYNEGGEKRQLALDYLANDLRLEWEIAVRMQF